MLQQFREVGSSKCEEPLCSNRTLQDDFALAAQGTISNADVTYELWRCTTLY